MDVYVVSNVWDREGATIIGAAVDRAGAEEVAGRVPDYPELRGRWGVWTARQDHSARSVVWERVALLADGSVHPSLTQEIVRVPLAGNVRAIPEPLIDDAATMRACVPVAAGQVVRYGAEIEDIGRSFGAP